LKLLSFFVLLASCCVALAQQQDSIYYSNYQLEEVTVIAPRLATPNRTPYALTQLDSSLIDQPYQNLSIKELLLQVPGVYVQNAYNFAQDARIAIRGFGSNAAFGIRGIKLIVDGIPETTPDGTGQLDNLNLDQIGKVSVIRGATSSLYGNASGGAIILNSRQFQKNYLTYQSVFGSYRFKSESLSAGMRSARTSYQTNVRYFESQGFRDHNEFRQLNARFAVNHELSKRVSVVLISEYMNSPEANDAGGLTLEETETDFRMARDRNKTFDAGEAIKQWKLGSSLKWQFSDRGKLNTYAFFNRRTFNGRLPFENSGIIELERNYYGFGNSLDLSAGIHSIKAGYDILSQTDERARFNNLEGMKGDIDFEQQESFLNVGLFVLDHIELGKWFFSSGLRFDLNVLSANDRFITDGDDSGEINMNNWSYQIGAGRQLSTGFQIFLNHSTSFETPTLNQLSNRPDNSGGFEDLEAATARNFEAGIKWNQNAAKLEIAAFHTQTENELVPYELETFPERTFFRNAGETVRNGVELAGSYQHTVFSIFASYTYSDFTFSEFIVNDNDLDGFRLPGIPRHQANLTSMIRPVPNLSISIPIQSVGSLWADNENETSVEQYIESSLMASYRLESGKLLLEPQLGIRNLFDVSYFDNIRINAFGNRFYEPAPGRNFYFGIKIRLTE